MKAPNILTLWTNNKTGALYFVQDVTNTLATREGWSVTVVYADDAGVMWSRPASEWFDRYTEVKASDIYSVDS